MADIQTNKEVSIFTQVATKAFIEAYKRLPADEDDWKEINKLTVGIWKNTKVNTNTILSIQEPQDHHLSDIEIPSSPF